VERRRKPGIAAADDADVAGDVAGEGGKNRSRDGGLVVWNGARFHADTSLLRP
jgi:hypothetical protein